jgi:hypothetical protein
MNWKLTLMLVALSVINSPSFGQSLTATYPTDIDTAGLDSGTLLSLEKQVVLNLSSSGGSSDTLIVELGPEAGSYDLLQRKFPLSQTGTFDDGCSLESSTGGLTIGLGTYTGLSSFHVKAYLASAGESTAVTASSQ